MLSRSVSISYTRTATTVGLLRDQISHLQASIDVAQRVQVKQIDPTLSSAKSATGGVPPEIQRLIGQVYRCKHTQVHDGSVQRCHRPALPFTQHCRHHIMGGGGEERGCEGLYERCAAVSVAKVPNPEPGQSDTVVHRCTASGFSNRDTPLATPGSMCPFHRSHRDTSQKGKKAERDRLKATATAVQGRCAQWSSTQGFAKLGPQGMEYITNTRESIQATGAAAGEAERAKERQREGEREKRRASASSAVNTGATTEGVEGDVSMDTKAEGEGEREREVLVPLEECNVRQAPWHREIYTLQMQAYVYDILRERERQAERERQQAQAQEQAVKAEGERESAAGESGETAPVATPAVAEGGTAAATEPVPSTTTATAPDTGSVTAPTTSDTTASTTAVDTAARGASDTTVSLTESGDVDMTVKTESK
ncbi:hypothetical protein KIPB_010563 [Kipferlia bialata]|uniref:Uncharacterized protein n=1 Tax=Kipferlia bialata TaxID=797122 RepID=A0A9K3D490_9EUKA|nr:hypothetical protein KIPB_010563 [Kipferlia bialata]|eukprot:g10563.t1